MSDEIRGCHYCVHFAAPQCTCWRPCLCNDFEIVRGDRIDSGCECYAETESEAERMCAECMRIIKEDAR